MLVDNQGIMLREGKRYWFAAVEGDPLVIFRIGLPVYQRLPEIERISADGNAMNSDLKKKNGADRIYQR